MVSLFLLILVASLMVVAIVIILYLVEKVRNYASFWFIIFLLVMMISMFVSASIYLNSPSSLSLALAFLTNSIVMVAFLVPFFIKARELTLRRYNGKNDCLISALAVLNEVIMGYTFELAQYGKYIFSNPLSYFTLSINNYWFYYSMMAEMFTLYLIYYLRGVKREVLTQIFPIVGITASPPILLDDKVWFYSSLLMSLGFCALGFRSRLNYLYVAMAIALLTTFFTPVIYELVLLYSMYTYYTIVFSVARNIISGK
ncbi:hypothetical protein WIW90_03935 [Sulfolobaceae archaeon RB850M]